MHRGLTGMAQLVLLALVSLFGQQSALAQKTDTPSKLADNSPHKSGFVTANGIKMHFLDWGGTGDPLLLLAGFASDAHIFDDFAPKFTDRFHVIALTRRGFGESDKPATGYDINTRVEDIRQFLDALKIKRANIVGHSMSGDEMTVLASLYPKRVGKLVYLDAAYNRKQAAELALSDPTAPPVWKRLTMEALDSPEAANIVVKDMPPREVWENYKAIVKALYTFHPDYTKVKAPILAFYVTSERYPFQLPPQADEATRRKADEWWLKNGVPYTRASIEQFRREAPRGQLIEMKDANHYIFLGQTAPQVVRQTREFLLK
jgi:pimeloyl-ACP methyl ester carboxylesterase